MKKLLILVLTLCLMLPFAALGESSAVLTGYDFGDFTLSFSSDMQGQVNEKADQQVYFMLLPDYDETTAFNKNLNCVWADGYTDLTAQDPQLMAEQILQSNVEGLRSSGIAIANEQLLGAELTELDGKPVLSIAMRYDADYTDAGVDFQTTLTVEQFIFSSESMGSYTFTLTGGSSADLDPLLTILSTLHWN